MWAHPLNVSRMHIRRPYGRRGHRPPEVPKARNIARLQGSPRSTGAILRAAVKVLGQYCGRCAQYVHYIYPPCIMWAHPLNVYPMHIRRPCGRRAHRLRDVPKARNIARLQGCPMSTGAILRAAVKVIGGSGGVDARFFPGTGMTRVITHTIAVCEGRFRTIWNGILRSCCCPITRKIARLPRDSWRHLAGGAMPCRTNHPQDASKSPWAVLQSCG